MLKLAIFGPDKMMGYYSDYEGKYSNIRDQLNTGPEHIPEYSCYPRQRHGSTLPLYPETLCNWSKA
jgi:hypothetical protein